MVGIMSHSRTGPASLHFYLTKSNLACEFMNMFPFGSSFMLQSLVRYATSWWYYIYIQPLWMWWESRRLANSTHNNRKTKQTWKNTPKYSFWPVAQMGLYVSLWPVSSFTEFKLMVNKFSSPWPKEKVIIWSKVGKRETEMMFGEPVTWPHWGCFCLPGLVFFYGQLLSEPVRQHCSRECQTDKWDNFTVLFHRAHPSIQESGQ